MKFTAPLCVLIAMGAAAPATAADGDAPASAPLCIRERDIKDSKVPDDQTIVFMLKNGKSYVNKLTGHCSGLTFHGFAYNGSPNGELCGNQTTIRVLKSGSVCLLGPFTPAPDESHN